MGTYSRHRLTVRGSDERTLKAIALDLESDLGANEGVLPFGTRNGATWDADGEAKWYSYDEDMHALAKRHPGVLFVLERLTEGYMDIRRFEYCEGAPPREPLTRDSLLNEISRSLRATHPDDAERMIAEVERSLLSQDDIAQVGVALYWASEVAALAGNFRSVFTARGPMVNAIDKLTVATGKVMRLVRFPKAA